MIIRTAISPGRFYPHDPLLLLQQVDACYSHPLGPGGFPGRTEQDFAVSTSHSRCDSSPIALIVPHGALGHSGPIAAHAYALLAVCAHMDAATSPGRIVVIGPDHLGLGSDVSATTLSYATPLGALPTDDSLVQRLVEINLGEDLNENLDKAPRGHASEHSVENQIPFLQHLLWRLTAEPNAVPRLPIEMPLLPRIIPLTMASPSLAAAQALAEILDTVLPPKGVLLLASSDMSHCGPFYANVPSQEPNSIASVATWCTQQTEQAVNAITAMDPNALKRVYDSANLSMCGVGCVLTAMEFARRRGATQAQLLARASSVEVASAWVGHLPTDRHNHVQPPWHLLLDVDAQNPVGFASIALI